MPYKRNLNADYSVEWTSQGGGIPIGKKCPLPCFSLGSGGANYQVLDDYPSVDDNTYNTVSEDGKYDWFTFSSFGFTEEAYFDYADEDHPGLAIALRGRYDNPGDAIQAIILVDGTEYEAETFAPDGYFDGAFVEYIFKWVKNPKTNDWWTYEELNGTAVSNMLQRVGYHSGSDATGERKVSRMYVLSYPLFQWQLVPVSDTAVQWSRQGNTYNWENLYWVYPNEHTNYNYTNVGNEIDKFGFDLINYEGDPDTIPEDSEVMQVYGMCDAKRSATGGTIHLGIWIDGTPYFEELMTNLDTDWTGEGQNDWWLANPKTSNPWTPDDINGVGDDKITHTGYKYIQQEGTAYIDQFSMLVEFFPNNEPGV